MLLLNTHLPSQTIERLVALTSSSHLVGDTKTYSQALLEVMLGLKD